MQKESYAIIAFIINKAGQILTLNTNSGSILPWSEHAIPSEHIEDPEKKPLDKFKEKLHEEARMDPACITFLVPFHKTYTIELPRKVGNDGNTHLSKPCEILRGTTEPNLHPMMNSDLFKWMTWDAFIKITPNELKDVYTQIYQDMKIDFQMSVLKSEISA